jgi:hypothetical protein
LITTYPPTPAPHTRYTAPFRLLSEDGVRALRGIVDENIDAGHAKENARNTAIRGLGYRSQWVRDMSYCPEVMKVFSALAQEELWPHDSVMNMGHTNLGKVGTGKAVDEWHTGRSLPVRRGARCPI